MEKNGLKTICIAYIDLDPSLNIQDEQIFKYEKDLILVSIVGINSFSKEDF